VEQHISVPIPCQDAASSLSFFPIKIYRHRKGHKEPYKRPRFSDWPVDIYGGARQTVVDPATFPIYSHAHHFCTQKPSLSIHMLITSVPSNLIVESEEMKLALPINEVDDGFVSLAEVRGAS
jgi:hypothetical protein